MIISIAARRTINSGWSSCGGTAREMGFQKKFSIANSSRISYVLIRPVCESSPDLIEQTPEDVVSTLNTYIISVNLYDFSRFIVCIQHASSAHGMKYPFYHSQIVPITTIILHINQFIMTSYKESDMCIFCGFIYCAEKATSIINHHLKTQAAKVQWEMRFSLWSG